MASKAVHLTLPVTRLGQSSQMGSQSRISQRALQKPVLVRPGPSNKEEVVLDPTHPHPHTKVIPSGCFSFTHGPPVLPELDSCPLGLFGALGYGLTVWLSALLWSWLAISLRLADLWGHNLLPVEVTCTARSITLVFPGLGWCQTS